MPISIDHIEKVFKERIAELLEEPEFHIEEIDASYALEDDGSPIVKVSAANVELSHDLWKGMRNPAGIGSYPAGLPEFWEFYAHRRKRSIDETGRRSIFQIPRSFSSAAEEYSRAVVISVMFPFSLNLIERYAKALINREDARPYSFKKIYDKVNLILEKAISRASVDFMSRENVVIPLDYGTVGSISKEVIPASRQGDSHGPCKQVHVPLKSLAVLTGLGQLGISRMLFRDEIRNGKVERFTGPLRSIVVFDKDEPVKKGEGGIIYLSEAYREFLFRLTDFTDTSPEINNYRYCSYVAENGRGCTQCLRYCPTGAQAYSRPDRNGEYSSNVAKQKHRFYDGKLQFDFARCIEDRSQMGSIFPEWSCARCITACAASGIRREFPASHYAEKVAELAVY